ncbi:uncharacterized protein LOC111007741 [Momordica charantia]|uniref:Uncharacterized protein LOC111007741 n=1 Tax=Momordica charantia TaxID=3673 RepID=A0A6J1C2T1_MOMCH|nr:uncharacterized protein LOC111007741 [Momordica charantia]
MSVEILDSATIINFVEDEEAFGAWIRERFRHLDADRDGVLSYAEMLQELHSLRVYETHFGVDAKPDPDELSRLYGAVFMQFDRNSNGEVDLEEFMAGTKRIMVAIAEGMGFLPLQMALEEDGFLMKAVRSEKSRQSGC